MHLLTRDEYGGFSLVHFYEGSVPPYAILSHTWGQDDDEVSFSDITVYRGTLQNRLTRKPGYQKLQFCAEKAATHGLHHFWVDTCCINKQSDRELSEAINSMFRWYQRAARCYVYLSDFTLSDGWQKFAEARWFTRGWTLQELLAAKRADFYDSNEEHLGDKDSLAEWITSTTGIPRAALQGRPLSSFSVEERLSWAQHRQTKREEDGAYSLLGIFDVSMPLIYGEGRDKAYGRLLYEVESSGQTSKVYQRYSQYLPFTESPDLGKALGKAIDPTPETHTSMSTPQQPPGQEMVPSWDDDLKRYIQVHWSEQYQRHYRRHYVEGM